MLRVRIEPRSALASYIYGSGSSSGGRPRFIRISSITRRRPGRRSSHRTARRFPGSGTIANPSSSVSTPGPGSSSIKPPRQQQHPPHPCPQRDQGGVQHRVPVGCPLRGLTRERIGGKPHQDHRHEKDRRHTYHRRHPPPPRPAPPRDPAASFRQAQSIQLLIARGEPQRSPRSPRTERIAVYCFPSCSPLHNVTWRVPPCPPRLRALGDLGGFF